MSENSQSSGDNRLADFLVDALERRIRGRSEAEQRAALDALLPEYRADQTLAPRGSRRYQLEELLGGSDTTFVSRAYREILGREPDMAGMESRLLALTEGGAARVAILGEIRYSPEGKERGALIEGLPLAYLLSRLRRLPTIGAAVGLLTNARLLPDYRSKTHELQSLVFGDAEAVNALQERLAATFGVSGSVDVGHKSGGSNLSLALSDDVPLSLATVLRLPRVHFITLAYRRCAGRSPSAEELALATQQLASGDTSPVAWLGRLCKDCDSNPADIGIVGLAEALRRDSWRRLPLLGLLVRFVESLALLVNLDTVLEAQRRESAQLLEDSELRLAQHYNSTLIELKRQVLDGANGGDEPAVREDGH